MPFYQRHPPIITVGHPTTIEPPCAVMSPMRAAGWPGDRELNKTIDAFAKLGVKVMITELDVNVLPSTWDQGSADITHNFALQQKLNPYPDGLPAAIQQQLAARYADLFRVFLKHRDAISRVTLWGVADQDSWLNDWPVHGRTSYPLLFDRQYQPKPAFEAVIKTAQAKAIPASAAKTSEPQTENASR